MIATVGHGARSAAELVSILQAAQIRTLIDVRAFPRFKRHPVEHAVHPQEELWRNV